LFQVWSWPSCWSASGELGAHGIGNPPSNFRHVALAGRVRLGPVTVRFLDAVRRWIRVRRPATVRLPNPVWCQVEPTGSMPRKSGRLRVADSSIGRGRSPNVRRWILVLNRLLRPWIVYTELTLSVLLVFVGFGQTVWGRGGPQSSAARTASSGNFIIVLGVVFLALSLLLLVLMRRRRPRR
jgi:hypothetical protein